MPRKYWHQSKNRCINLYSHIKISWCAMLGVEQCPGWGELVKPCKAKHLLEHATYVQPRIYVPSGNCQRMCKWGKKHSEGVPFCKHVCIYIYIHGGNTIRDILYLNVIYTCAYECSQPEFQQIEAGNENMDEAFRKCNSWWPSVSYAKPPDKRGLR